MPALQGQDKVENPVAIPAQCYLSTILGLHGCKAGLTDLGASASSLETDGPEEKVCVLQEHGQELNHPSKWSSTGL